MNRVSQRTIVEVARALREYATPSPGWDTAGKFATDFTEVLFAKGFPIWFVRYAESEYQWRWLDILFALHEGSFFFTEFSTSKDNITGKYLPDREAPMLGEELIQKLAAFATTLPTGQAVLRSLQLDGFDVHKQSLMLVPLEGPVSAQQEEDALTALVKGSRLPDTETILAHMRDAHGLYTQGKYHPSLGESRNVIQALIDGISTESHAKGNHPHGLPDGTANRMNYLRDVGFLDADEKAALSSAWSMLCAGSHPGIPERELARIGLVLALEFGQLLLLKLKEWATNAYQKFS